MKAKSAYLLVGSRKINKRISLFWSGLQADGFSVRLYSLPRMRWNFTDTEELSHVNTGFLTALMANAPERLVVPEFIFCFHWAMLPVACFFTLLGSKVIYDEHDFYELNTLEHNKWKGKLLASVIKSFHYLFLRKVDLITCIHMVDSILLKNLKKYNENVIELHNYPMKKWLSPHKKSGPIIFIYVGGIYAEKGCKAAADAFLRASKERNCHFEFHFFGGGDTKLLHWLGNQARIFVHGPTPSQEIRNFISTKKTIGLLLYKSTPRYTLIGTNSRKFYEYLITGTPVIATKVGELTTVVAEHALGYLVNSTLDIEEIERVFLSIMENPAVIDGISANCIDYMLRNKNFWSTEWKKVTDSEIFK